MRDQIRHILFFLCIFGCFSIPVSTEHPTIDAPSQIKSVVVYLNMASVERQFQREIETGLVTLKFSHLPRFLLDQSIQVSTEGGVEAKILNVRVKKEFLKESFQKKVQDLMDNRQDIIHRKSRLNDRMESVKKREGLLGQLTSKTAESISNQKTVHPPVLSEWGKMLDFYESQLNQMTDKKREIAQQLLALEGELRIIENQLSQHKQGKIREEKNIYIDVSVARRGRLKMAVTYLTPGASWYPLYDVRFSQEKKNANLAYFAMVKQQTGEDWKNVDLTFTTAQPMVIKDIPKLTPSFMGKPKLRTGELIGVVEDSDGNALPGVLATLTGSYGWRGTAVSDENGEFRIGRLASGNYNLELSMEGFKTQMINGISIFSNKISRIKGQLDLGEIQTMVEVRGEAPMIDVKDSSYGRTFKRGNDFRLPGGSGGSLLSSTGKKSKRTKAPQIRLEEKPMGDLLDISSMSQTSVTTSFKTTHKETISGNTRDQKVSITVNDFPVSFTHVAIPRVSQRTYLKAKVKNRTTAPLLPGRINVFFEGTFVNASKIKYVNPADSFDVPVGIDESILVERDTFDQTSKIKGMLKKKEKKILGYKIKAKNFKKTDVKMKIYDQIPIAKFEKIVINVLTIDPKPVEKKEKEDDGLLEWDISLKPGEEKVLTVKYEVIFPKGMLVEEWN